ncbi:biotin--[acetyl-CoA-carboxylase] ligase [Halothiobacillus sp. DCM-1]|uniref:biotin--[acetyl-CoA-carboxylase] ligase n=1 Tax=Halothiobacillus sp. DCM-1 TaxID=3112558 RepID=UPI003244CEAE
MSLDWVAAEGGIGWWFDEVESTQDALKRRVTHAEESPDWALCLAAAQTAGRGRQGHVWVSAAGQGLWFSLLVPARVFEQTSGQGSDAMPQPPVALLAADALCQALVAEGFAVGIKWPNDLWLNNAKVGGILVEAWRWRGEPYWVVGVGLNWWAPATTQLQDKTGEPIRVTGLLDAAAGLVADRAGLSRRIITALRDGLRSPSQWPERLSRLKENHLLWQQRVSVWMQGAKIAEGRAGALTPHGELTLITDAGDSLTIGGSASVRVIP